MIRPLLATLVTLLAPLAPLCTEARAARTLEAVEYFSPVAFRLVLTRELPPATTAKGVANAVSVVRYGNRELLAPIIAEHGGKLSDWSLVAYSSTFAFDSSST